MSDKEDKACSSYPPWKLMRVFLLVTILIILGTAVFGSTLFNMYLYDEPRIVAVGLFTLIILFCVINVGVTRGSFLCATILKYYALFLFFSSLWGLSGAENNIHYIISFINIVAMFGAFYLISGKSYQELVKYKHDFFEDIKETRRVIEQQLAVSTKAKHVGKKYKGSE